MKASISLSWAGVVSMYALANCCSALLAESDFEAAAWFICDDSALAGFRAFVGAMLMKAEAASRTEVTMFAVKSELTFFSSRCVCGSSLARWHEPCEHAFGPQKPVSFFRDAADERHETAKTDDDAPRMGKARATLPYSCSPGLMLFTQLLGTLIVVVLKAVR